MRLSNQIKLIISVMLLVHSVNMAAVGLNTPCDIDADCNPPYSICNTDTKMCAHKEIFPIEYLEFIGIIVLAVVIAASNAGGIGGGGIIVPICLAFF